MASLTRLLPRQHYEVVTINAGELLAGGWQARTALLVMPGGADLPYCKHLNGTGNAHIRDFVATGGSYLGICAGAYYACARIEFEPGGTMEVVGDRELRFFPGAARGAVVPGFDYQTERGAAAVRVRYVEPDHLHQQLDKQWQCPPQLGRHHGKAQANGRQSRHSDAQQLSEPGLSTAQSHREHTRASPTAWRDTVDYCNGGPLFTSPSGGEDWAPGEVPGVQVLARYVGLPPSNLERLRPGGSQAVASSSAGLAAAVSAVAAVRCSVGHGAAVLCGTHPELEPRWIDTCGLTQARMAAEHAQPSSPLSVSGSMSSEGEGSPAHGGVTAVSAESCPDTQLARHSAALHAALEKEQEGRDGLLRTLLVAALAHRPQGVSLS